MHHGSGFIPRYHFKDSNFSRFRNHITNIFFNIALVFPPLRPQSCIIPYPAIPIWESNLPLPRTISHFDQQPYPTDSSTAWTRRGCFNYRQSSPWTDHRVGLRCQGSSRLKNVFSVFVATVATKASYALTISGLRSGNNPISLATLATAVASGKRL